MTTWPTAPVIRAVMRREEWRTPRVIWTRTAKGNYTSELHGVALRGMCEFDDITQYWEQEEIEEAEGIVYFWDVIEPGKLYWVEYSDDGKPRCNVMMRRGNEIVGFNYGFWEHDETMSLMGATELVYMPRELWETIYKNLYGRHEVTDAANWMQDKEANK